MTTKHPQEKIIKTFHYNGIEVELAEWNETKWCGKIGYAPDNMDEPDVEKIMNDFFEVNDSAAAYEREEGWDVCISFNYLSEEKPNGVMFGFMVGMENQPDCFDIVHLPSALYMRIRISDATAAAVGCEPWEGGIPPYEWITEKIAPKLGYKSGDDKAPIIEYYGYFDSLKNKHEFCYLYVPVIKNNHERV